MCCLWDTMLPYEQFMFRIYYVVKQFMFRIYYIVKLLLLIHVTLHTST